VFVLVYGLSALHFVVLFDPTKRKRFIYWVLPSTLAWTYLGATLLITVIWALSYPFSLCLQR
jgi:hypothetical protein